MNFCQEMRKQADPIFKALFQHPFVRGIAEGNLQKEQLIHYVKQDFEYLNTFMKMYGLAIAKCEQREDIAFFNEGINHILHSEVHPHNNLCRVAGVRYEDLQGFPSAPTASHYMNHMLSVGKSGTLGETLAVLAACPWTYWEIGDLLYKEVQPDENHPFYEWIYFYGNESMGERMQTWQYRLNQCALVASTQEQNKMMKHFLTSCQLEYMFFDMAYHLEQWPVSFNQDVVGSVTG